MKNRIKNRPSAPVQRQIKISTQSCWVLASYLLFAGMATAEPLNTALPKKTYNIPAGDLSDTLPGYAAEAGILLGFDPALTQGKRGHVLNGQFTLQEGFETMLKDTGLEVIQDKTGHYQLRRATPKPKPIPGAPEKTENQSLKLEGIEVRAKRFYEVGPLPGLGLTKEEIPGNVQSISAKEIKEAHSLSITDLMNQKLQSVTVNDYQGNPFQMDVQYRGFTAGPQIGTPQGLSVFLDGIRVNEPFGDVVNWDMIPMNALAGVDVFPGSNPIFGLNTLGGAFSMKTKDGFNNAGVDADILTGSFGRKQLQAEGGWNNGTVGLFAAGNFFLEDGWRENSPSRVNQLFTKASYRGDKLDLNLSTLLVQTDLTGNGMLPSQMYSQDRNSVYTSPDTTKNQLAQFQLSGSYFVNDSFTVTGQVYRRNSKRHQVGSDVFTDWNDNAVYARRLPATGEQYACLFASSPDNKYGIPDYYLIPINETAGENLYIPGSVAGDFFNEYNSNNFQVTSFNQYKNVDLDEDYAKLLKQTFDYWRNERESLVYNRDNPAPVTEGPQILDAFGNSVASYMSGGSTFPNGNAYNVNGPDDNVLNPDSINDLYYYKTDDVTGDLIKYQLVLTAPVNAINCNATRALDGVQGKPYSVVDSDGNAVFVDGATGGYKADGTGFPGVVEGTPTAIINDNKINQIVNGASLQLNWNLEHHKVMVGMSIDAADATYKNTSQLGFLTADREAYLDPSQAHPQFIGAQLPISNNNFSGTNITKSIYFSETWTPVDTLHINTSARYNQTIAKNKIAARYGRGAYMIGDLIGLPDAYNICTDVDGDGDVDADDCASVPANFRTPRIFNTLNKAETEKFSYYSLNPSLGVSWQAKEMLNLYANFAQGTRTPSVVELGCAFDDTLVASNGGGLGPKSIVENRQCTLPTTLSGDPFLPQIKATTYDIGLRGKLSENMQWNLGAYQTDLKDDIYFVSVGNGAGFFDSIGNTRRRGIEAGVSGRKDKWGMSVNYSLTDATFENNFLMISNDNSSSYFLNGYGNVIQVEKGDRIPGVSLHNMNANLSYDVTDAWTVGLSAVLHSDSYVRGNENNEHRVGVVQDRGLGAVGNAQRRPTSNPGTVPGYAVFNFRTSYRLSKEWTANLLINNIFDREYFTAGRLGRNPFSPSINGAIGPDGYNHNSDDWLSTNFIAPGAPRGIWFSLNWHFVPD